MGYHVHRQIREAAVTALTGLTTTAARVYANRLYPIPAASLPALRVGVDDETIESYTIHGAAATLSRSLVLVVECCAQGGDTVDDTCDAMTKEVETALSAGISMAGRTYYPLLLGSRYDDEAGGQDAAVKRLEYRLHVSTKANAPDTLT
jgi:hypothetical protein